jgi:hypothetical protein
MADAQITTLVLMMPLVHRVRFDCIISSGSVGAEPGTNIIVSTARKGVLVESETSSFPVLSSALAGISQKRAVEEVRGRWSHEQL